MKSPTEPRPVAKEVSRGGVGTQRPGGSGRAAGKDRQGGDAVEVGDGTGQPSGDCANVA